MKSKDVNQVTFEDLLKPLAEELDIYSKANSRGLGDLEYSDECIKIFKNLVECMAECHEESVNESDVLIESYDDFVESKQYDVNESSETGLIFKPRTNRDANKLNNIMDDLDYQGEWNHREGYFLFPEDEDMYDDLEMELQDIFDKHKIDGYFEGVFESLKNRDVNESSKIKSKKDFIKAFKGAHDAYVYVDGEKFIAYNPESIKGNDDIPDATNTEFKAFDEDGDEYSMEYSEIEKFITENINDVNESTSIAKSTKKVHSKGKTPSNIAEEVEELRKRREEAASDALNARFDAEEQEMLGDSRKARKFRKVQDISRMEADKYQRMIQRIIDTASDEEIRLINKLNKTSY